MKRVKRKGKNVVLSLILLVLGFMISYSYQFTKNETKGGGSDQQWKQEYRYRQMLIDQEERNRKLQRELFAKQEKVRKTEEGLAKKEQDLAKIVDDVKKYRMYTGKVGVKGKGLEVTLSDASYIPSEENANHYIVHEGHVFKVINELLVSGASAIEINGQRISKNSYIMCNGPVITVDGNQFPAPFVISATGDPDVLDTALNLAGGVKDQLVKDNIVVKMNKKSEIVMAPLINAREQQTFSK
ncbi:DUF881 domain-containing protein [Priestia koreensis]|uniref:DUF881 domain-containing protein n=1 Tax=Priestia koreensis TaxID=284581 RepID=UPI0020402408|nr:DUF881 domain-containing protein [Priestia koreensis]MCM3003863.1 DUF881 domain-containing protein [Priestia koreensis]